MVWERLSDHLFGYDYFISYSQADQREYAVKLRDMLVADQCKFRVFLDSFEYAFYTTVLGRAPNLDEVNGIAAAWQENLTPFTKLTMFDQAGRVMGQATAGMLLAELPFFIAENNGVTPGVRLPDRRLLSLGNSVNSKLPTLSRPTTIIPRHGRRAAEQRLRSGGRYGQKLRDAIAHARPDVRPQCRQNVACSLCFV